MNAIAKSDLFTPLFALDRLNSWIRCCEPFWDRPRDQMKRTVYWVKTHAILDVSKRWNIGLRRVKVIKPCRSCDGTGTWVPERWNGWQADTWEEYRDNYGERCRTCNGFGKVNLLFIESTIGPIRWHTPADKWYMSSLDVYLPFPSFYGERDAENFYEAAEDWEPLQPGRPLSHGDALRDMVILLRAWPHDVCFSLECAFRIGCSPYHRVSLVDVAEKFLVELFEHRA